MERPVKKTLYQKDSPYATKNVYNRLIKAVERGNAEKSYQLLLNYRFADMKIKDAISSNEKRLEDQETTYLALKCTKENGYFMGLEREFNKRIWPLKDEIQQRKKIRDMLNGIPLPADEESDWYE